MALRFDRGSLRPAKRTDDGRLVADAYVTRTGVFVYRDASGKERRELRLPEEVFATQALETLQLATVTDDHPREMVNATNARELAVGAVGQDVRRDGDFVRATIAVFDATTIEKMQRGKAQLSCGYECDLEETAGTHAGERYDAIQRRIRINHVAIVETGRAGPEVRARLDGAAYQLEDTMDKTPDRTDADRLEGEVETLRARIAQLEEQVRQRTDAAERGDAYKKQVDELEAKLLDSERLRRDAEDPRRIHALVQSRLHLERLAGAVLGSVDLTGKSDRQLRIDVIEKATGTKVDPHKPDAYVEARFDSTVEHYLAGAAEVREAGRAIMSASLKPPRDAWAEHAERQRNAWRQAGK